MLFDMNALLMSVSGSCALPEREVWISLVISSHYLDIIASLRRLIEKVSKSEPLRDGFASACLQRRCNSSVPFQTEY